MKLLLLNQDWFADEFRAAGHEVLTCGMRPHLDYLLDFPLKHIKDIYKMLPVGFEPDALIVFDESAPIFFGGAEDVDVPVFFYSVDAHHHISYHKYLAFVFDCVFVAMKDYLFEFDKIGAEAEWMPLWASRHIEPSNDKEFEAVFVGNLDPKLNPQRVKFFEELSKHAPIFFKIGKYWEIFPYSEIVVNQTVKGDLNFRVFEAMMSGALLLTEDSPNGLKELFTPGEHLITYKRNNVREAADKINTLLADKAKCREIGLAGREEILKSHCLEHRAQRILEKVETLKKRSSNKKYFSLIPNHVWLCRGVQEKDMAHALRIGKVMTDLLEKGIKRGEDLTEELSWHAVRACLEYDSMTRTNRGEHLIDKLNEAYPGSNVPHVARIWLRLNRGEVEEATRMVQETTENEPHEVFTKIHTMFAQMLYEEKKQ